MSPGTYLPRHYRPYVWKIAQGEHALDAYLFKAQQTPTSK